MYLICSLSGLFSFIGLEEVSIDIVDRHFNNDWEAFYYQTWKLYQYFFCLFPHSTPNFCKFVCLKSIRQKIGEEICIFPLFSSPLNYIFSPTWYLAIFLGVKQKNIFPCIIHDRYILYFFTFKKTLILYLWMICVLQLLIFYLNAVLWTLNISTRKRIFWQT